MKTPESVRLARMFSEATSDVQKASEGAALGSFFLAKARSASQGWSGLRPSAVTEKQRQLMLMALRTADEVEATPIGKGIHRPYRITFQTAMTFGDVTTRYGAMKTLYCQHENTRYCKTMDLSISSPSRELIAHDLDQALDFNLVPPTVEREIESLGYGSVQAWVNQPTAFQWQDKGYDYREDRMNPWLHKLAAFHFISGQIDGHSNNFIIDQNGRTYAIDNGYAFGKGDDRSFFRSSAGKALKGTPIHPEVRMEVSAINEDRAREVFRNRGFRFGEEDGVIKRIRELKRLNVWQKLGELW